MTTQRKHFIKTTVVYLNEAENKAGEKNACTYIKMALVAETHTRAK